jgi:hypothetical protein
VSIPEPKVSVPNQILSTPEHGLSNLSNLSTRQIQPEHAFKGPTLVLKGLGLAPLSSGYTFLVLARSADPILTLTRIPLELFLDLLSLTSKLIISL